MRNTLQRVFDNARFPVVFLLGVVLLGAAGNGLYETLGQWIKSPSIRLVAALALTVVLAFIAKPMQHLRDLVRRMMPERFDVRTKRSGKRYRGLIAFASMGKGISSAREAIRYHSGEDGDASALRYCWLIASDGSRGGAEGLKQEFEGRVNIEIVPMSNAEADDPMVVYDRVDSLFREAARKHGDLSAEDLIADYTGGTKSMTAGMVLAAAPPERRIQFMKPRGYDANGQADHALGSDPVEVEIGFEIRRAGAGREREGALGTQ